MNKCNRIPAFARRALAAITCIGAVATLAACSSSAEPNYYFLDTSAEPVSEYRSRELVGLQEVVLPTYALNEKLPTLLDNGAVTLDDDNRWTGAPEEAVALNLARQLESAIARRITASPYPIGVQPDIQIKVVFDRLIRASDGGAEIGGQFHVIDDRRRSVLATERFRYDIPATESGYAGYMLAIDTGLEQLAQTIAASSEAL